MASVDWLRAFRIGLFLGVLCPVIAPATQFWQREDPNQWTLEEIQQLLNDSPWSQRTAATIPEKRADNSGIGPATADPSGGVGKGSGLYLPGNQQGVRWDGGGVVKNRGTPATIPVLVRWESAQPVREALLRSHNDASDPALTEPGRAYVLAIAGLWPGTGMKRSTQPENEQYADPTADPHPQNQAPPGLGAMRQSLMNTARILRRGKAPLAPEDVKLDPTTGTIFILFPNKDPIELSEKEVVFTTRFGALQITKKFRLKEMAYKGALEL